MSTNDERRIRRSENLHQALRYQLQHVKERYGIDQLAVADESGLFISGSDQPQLDHVAASYSCAIAKSDHEKGERLTSELLNLLPCSAAARVQLREFDLDGRSAFICAVADESADLGSAFDHSLVGVRRIAATAGV
jgi:hypothetical protein